MYSSATASANGPTAADDRERARLERALDNLKKLFTWGDHSEVEYRRQREDVERKLGALGHDSTPVALLDVRRAGDLLNNIGGLWMHPGVSPERRKEFIEEVFDEIQLDENGIRVVLPRAEYQPLVAVADACRGGYGRGDWI